MSDNGGQSVLRCGGAGREAGAKDMGGGGGRGGGGGGGGGGGCACMCSRARTHVQGKEMNTRTTVRIRM